MRPLLLCLTQYTYCGGATPPSEIVSDGVGSCKRSTGKCTSDGGSCMAGGLAKGGVSKVSQRSKSKVEKGSSVGPTSP